MLSLIVAMTRSRVIGVENRLPWRLPEDLKRFRRLTTGHAIIMGRKTYESIGKPLPDRHNIVISRRTDYHPAGVTVVPSLDAAISAAHEHSKATTAAGGTNSSDEVFVIGGAEIYALALPRADRLYLTWVEREITGDAHFPAFDPTQYRQIETEDHSMSDPPFSYLTLDKIR